MSYMEWKTESALQKHRIWEISYSHIFIQLYGKRNQRNYDRIKKKIDKNWRKKKRREEIRGENGKKRNKKRWNKSTRN